ncbi:MAG TPA: SUF system NifU family Fe-S cluster assembly protein [Opitutales bacterium]|nr:SUF system NifU family Fe-S cluster assembly protein [Opitutales bacterium]
MTDDLSELYQTIILEHHKHPRNAHVMEHPTHEAEGHNPLCGDEIKVYVRLKDGRVQDVSFKGQGCAISQASASLMTEAIKGKTLEELHSIEKQALSFLGAGEETSAPDLAQVGDLAALSGVRHFPARVKCATLSWHTLDAALEGHKSVSTES